MRKNMTYDFDRPVDRRGTYSMKWDGPSLMESFFPGIGECEKEPLCVFTADMDFQCAESIREELQKIVDRNLYGYTGLAPTAEVCKPYYDAVTGWFKRHYGWEIDPETIVYTPGTVNAVDIAIKTFSKEGEGVLINPPIYGPFAMSIEGAGRKVVRSPLINTGGYYTVDFAGFEEKAKDPNTKIFILCSPHNPTGRIWTPEELRRMYGICTANGVVVVTDEIHGDLIRKGETFHPMATVVDGKNLVSCTAANKTFNLADLKTTNVVIRDPEMRAQYSKSLGFTFPNIFTIAATIGAYNGGQEWLDQVRDYLDGTIDWVLDFVKEKMPRVKIRRPEGTYVLWMDFRGYGLTPDEVNDRILKKAGVVLERGEMFDQELGAGFQRICVPTQRAVIQECFRRMEEVFEH
ncbi:MAG: aminotransferase class I/II-fold pyridoxal phosphate-dependent enzyme [Oscillospiraceae bacterium]|jgi:cystathionine beta-lyase|nr:aminotransferase class I/II-fold pyridoxal phosphate-dependent enzyme [Oscillospiraceae bacterium]